MKSICLIKNDKENSVYAYFEVNDKIENVGNLIKDSVKELVIVNQKDPKFQTLLSKAKTRINFNRISSKGPDTESQMTRDYLSKKEGSLSCIAIFYNSVGEKIGILASDASGKVSAIPINVVIDGLRSKTCGLNNIFLRNGKELVLTKGNYDANGSKVPIIYIGKALGENKVDPHKNLDNLVEKDKDYDLKYLNRFKAPVKAMITHGFKRYVELFKLGDPSIPDTNLWFYYSLLKNGDYKSVGSLITKQNFNTNQLIELHKGLRSGVDVNKYANSSLSYLEMRNIREKLERGTFDGIVMTDKLKKLMNDYQASGFSDEKRAVAIDKIAAAMKKGSK